MRLAARIVGALLVVLGAALLLLPSGPPRAPATSTAPGIDCAWDPVTGRGEVRVTRADGSRALVRLEDRFAGYAGGLVLGSQDRAAYVVEPAGAAAAKPVGLWCAQDESILVRDADASAGAPPIELDHGWSENVGGPVDGVPLRYMGGALLANDADGLLLAARNVARGLAVDRWLLVLPDGTLLVRARLSVVEGEARPTASPAGGSEERAPAGRARSIDWWLGDDPWVGAYGTSHGDCAWTQDGLIRTEASLDPARVTALGIADAPDRRPGGEAAGSSPEGGERAVPRSGTLDPSRPAALANAFVLGPRCPRPDRALIADGFAHDPAEVAARRPLGRGPGSVAFNVGWLARRLERDASLELTYALGVADTSGALPRPPTIPDAAWQRLESAPPAPTAPPSDLSFAWERVVVEVAPTADSVLVRGTYGLAPPAGVTVQRAIFFPFAVDAAHPTPDQVRVSVDAPAGPRALPFDRLRDGIVFTVDAPGTEVVVHVDYRQSTTDRAATYILTSARAWPDPIGRATLEVHLPPGLDLVDASLPLEGPTADAAGRRWTFSGTSFRPDRDLTVRWR